jgi:sugar phosphate isomerase/epimerase
VLARVPPGWIAPGPAADRVLGCTLQLLAPDLERRGRAVAIARRVLAAAPAARIGVTLHEVRSVSEAERAFTALARECEERGEAHLTSYGVLLDDAELYRSLLARRPLALLRPGTRAARALADVASLLRADFAGDAG